MLHSFPGVVVACLVLLANAAGQAQLGSAAPVLETSVVETAIASSAVVPGSTPNSVDRDKDDDHATSNFSGERDSVDRRDRTGSKGRSRNEEPAPDDDELAAKRAMFDEIMEAERRSIKDRGRHNGGRHGLNAFVVLGAVVGILGYVSNMNHVASITNIVCCAPG